MIDKIKKLQPNTLDDKYSVLTDKINEVVLHINELIEINTKTKYCRECGEFIKECDRHDGLCIDCNPRIPIRSINIRNRN